MKDESSRQTRNALFALFSPYTIANGALLLMFAVLIIFRPSADNPNSFWSIGVMALLGLTALWIIISSSIKGLKKLNASAREDRRRLALGLPVEKDSPLPDSRDEI